ncbi:esterase [Mycolicibacterium aromaticivorans JS19b1 = JCM 16368]|uniref:Esterase n=1 Tax=Mycolicibacterium aromaticivorans JS19b1 = JCM 16368 TaxID=1440774 RepID=A0A064CIK3_9MYCO|nr:alpha/beta hydrolase [Mycolicibacterium aromaticivorans]KDF00156.1 esterase [Mycolicibacterium aromaticivorans JS19b1 = JCM 16368]
MTVRPWTTARWLMQAGPADYLMAMSMASAQLPVVGKHLEPLGALSAMSVWGAKQMPELLGAAAKSWLAPDAGRVRRVQRESTRQVAETGLRGVVLPEDLQIDWPAPDTKPPVARALEHRKHLYRSSVRYGDHPTQVLDVWRRKDLPAEPAPVLVFVPGGAWVHGSRILQGYALMSHLAAQGWVCLSVEYRVAPHHPWPQHIHDIKAAIAWARANVDRFGGDRDFVAVAGCSAGGHLAALAGLTIDDPEFQEHLPEGSDTAVDAVVGIYGRYDWEDRSTPERIRFVDFLERVVVNKKQSKHADLFRKASPIARIHPKAPPFLVVHGSGDSVIPVAQAQSFVERLRSVSHSPVGYVELPGAGHGFDMTDGARTGSVSTAIGLFLNRIHRDRAAMSTKEVI